MRKLLLLLLLSACDSRAPSRDGEPPVPQVPVPDLSDLQRVEAGASPDQLQESAAQALGNGYPELQAPRFAGLREGRQGAVCGLVDAAALPGGGPGPRPFVVTPVGAAVISMSPEIRFSDPLDPFPDIHLEWCATTEELARIPARLSDPLPPPLPRVEPAELPAEPEPPPPVAAPDRNEGPLPEPPRPELAPPKPRPEGEDSFSSAVLRPKQ